MHGGVDITVADRPSGGAEFRIQLPLSRSGAPGTDEQQPNRFPSWRLTMTRVFVYSAYSPVGPTPTPMGARWHSQDVPPEYDSVLKALGKQGDYKAMCSR